MILAVCWVPKGASKTVPVAAELPSKVEIEEMLKIMALEGSGDRKEEGEDMDEVAHAIAAAEALDKSSSGFEDIGDGLQELDMDKYDLEDDGNKLFSDGQGDLYHSSNDMDQYLQNKDDDDDEEIDDMIIKPTDAVIVCARYKEKGSSLKVWIFEELENGNSNMYVHRNISLPTSVVCTVWLDCKPRSGDKGNFIAIGSMETAIEIWDLDVLDEVQPFMVLGGVAKKKKLGEEPVVKYKKGSHTDSVLGLAWNTEIRNALASASADKSVKVWDMVSGECAVTLEHHTDTVQAVAWNRRSPEVLLSGSFDKSVVMIDVRSSSCASTKWAVTAAVEKLAWDPHNEHSFVVSLADGTVRGFDIRAAASDSFPGSKPCFTIHAHDEAVSSVCYNPSAANLLATGSEDKMVKLWDISNNQPSCIASRNPKTGKVFSISFSEDSPYLLAIGGSEGRLNVWDTLTEQGVIRRFGKSSY